MLIQTKIRLSIYMVPLSKFAIILYHYSYVRHNAWFIALFDASFLLSWLKLHISLLLSYWRDEDNFHFILWKPKELIKQIFLLLFFEEVDEELRWTWVSIE